MQFYNLSVDISSRKCVVVGGGKVALRKVRKLCVAEAEVVVVSPEVLPEFYEENCTIIYEKYRKNILQNAVLVFAATSDFIVNQQVCEDAKAMGIWVNSVNGTKYSSFIIPATCRKDILTLGVTTEGKAPTLSKELRKYFQEKLANIDGDVLAEIVSLREQKVEEEDVKIKLDLELEINTKAKEIIRQIEEK